MNQYKLISKKGEGTFSEVLKAESQKTGKQFAIKCMKNIFATEDMVNNLREIQALKRLSPHDHIIKLHEILYDQPTGRLALVFELMDCNLYEHIKGRKQYLNSTKVKFYMYQLLRAIEHMHRNNIFHRDIKPENILMTGDQVKLADFGSCKRINAEHPYTEYISTRWYRAPECLLTDGYYDYKMDLWGVGCVMFEITGLFPLFPGNNELDQIHKIHNVLGTPKSDILERFRKHATHMEFNFPPQQGTGIDKLLPNASKDCLDLIKKLLAYDPDDRITAQQALRHDYFREFYEMEQHKAIPTSLSAQKVLKKNSLQGGSNHEENPKQSSRTTNHENPGVVDDDKQTNLTKKQPFVNVGKPLQNKNSILNAQPQAGPKKKESVYRSVQGQDTSTEEEGEKFLFPPIKNPQQLQVGIQFIEKPKIPKQYGSKWHKTMLKPTNSNQFLKKSKKSNGNEYPGDYILYGKKKGLANTNTNVSLQSQSPNSSLFLKNIQPYD